MSNVKHIHKQFFFCIFLWKEKFFAAGITRYTSDRQLCRLYLVFDRCYVPPFLRHWLSGLNFFSHIIFCCLFCNFLCCFPFEICRHYWCYLFICFFLFLKLAAASWSNPLSCFIFLVLFAYYIFAFQCVLFGIWL